MQKCIYAKIYIKNLLHIVGTPKKRLELRVCFGIIIPKKSNHLFRLPTLFTFEALKQNNQNELS